MNRKPLLWLGLLALLGGHSAPADATIFVRVLDAGTLVARSQLVVFGRVEAMQSRWDGGRIVTDLQIGVLDAAKGAPQSHLPVVVSGGAVDGVRMRVIGAAEFDLGEEAILYLNHSDAWRLVHLAQGKLAVATDRTVKWTPPEGGHTETWPVAQVLDRLRVVVGEGRQ